MKKLLLPRLAKKTNLNEIQYNLLCNYFAITYQSNTKAPPNITPHCLFNGS